jgi:hypothetical protein
VTPPEEFSDVSLGKPAIEDSLLASDAHDVVHLAFSPTPAPGLDWLDHLKKLLDSKRSPGSSSWFGFHLTYDKVLLDRVPIEQLDSILDVVEQCVVDTNRWVREEVMPARARAQETGEEWAIKREQTLDEARRRLDQRYGHSD